MNTDIKMIRESVEEIARKYLGIPILHKVNHGEVVHLTHKQIEKALKESYKMGERSGYKCGYSDAKKACECDLEEVDGESSLDILKHLV